MTTELAETPKTPEEQFRDRLEERIRSDIGELMPSETLAAMIERAMEKIFFEKVERKHGYQTTYDDPWFIQVVRELTEEKVKEAAKKWVEDNAEKVEGIIRERFAKGVFGAFVDGFEAQLRQNGWDLELRLREVLSGVKRPEEF